MAVDVDSMILRFDRLSIFNTSEMVLGIDGISHVFQQNSEPF